MKKLILKICFACNLIAIVCLPFLWSITCYAAEDAPKKTELSSIATIIGGILWLIVGIIITIMRLKNTVFFGTREGISNAKFSVLLTSFVIAGIIVAPIIIVINWLVNIIIGILKILVIAIVVIVVIAVVLCIIGFVLSKISSTGKNANVENDPDENITNSTNVMPVEVSDSSNIPSSDPDKEKASSEIVRDIDNSVQIKSETKQCPKCGQVLNNELKFCAVCGYKFEENNAPIHQPGNMSNNTFHATQNAVNDEKNTNYALLAWILAIVSLVLVLFLGLGPIFIGPFVLYFAIKGLKTEKKTSCILAIVFEGLQVIISIVLIISLVLFIAFSEPDGSTSADYSKEGMEYLIDHYGEYYRQEVTEYGTYTYCVSVVKLNDNYAYVEVNGPDGEYMELNLEYTPNTDTFYHLYKDKDFPILIYFYDDGELDVKVYEQITGHEVEFLNDLTGTYTISENGF